MALKIAKHNVAEVAVVVLDGRVVLGEESSELRNAIKGLLAEGAKRKSSSTSLGSVLSTAPDLERSLLFITPPRRKAARWHFASLGKNSKSSCR